MFVYMVMCHVWRRALDFEVEGQTKKGRPKRTWKRQVEEDSVKGGLRRKSTLCHCKWGVNIKKLLLGLRCIWPTSIIGVTARF